MVELLVVIAIMAIVGGSITSFVIVSQKNYNSGTAEVDLQYEAQLVANQLQDLLIDTARGISYSYDRKLADGTEEDRLVADDSQIGAEDVVSTKSLYIYNVDKFYRLLWNQEKNEIRFFTYDVSAPDVPEGAPEGELLAEFVTGFSVDLREVSENRTVKYVISFTKQGSGQTYTTSHKIKLRNEVLVNASMDAIYVPDENEIIPNAILITPSELTLWPGEGAGVYARVTAAGGAVPSQSVIWRIDGARDASTAVETGGSVLTLGEGETGDESRGHKLFVTADKPLGGGGTLTGPDPGVTVYVRGITHIQAKDDKGQTDSGTDNKLTAGKSVTVTAELSGYNVSGLSAADMGGVNIEIVEGSGYLTDIAPVSATGTVSFTVNKDIDFTAHPKPVVRIRFQAAREGFSGVACEMVYTLEKSGDFDVEVISGAPWKRKGQLRIQLTDVNPDWLYTDDMGKVHIKKNDVVYVTLRIYDSATNWTSFGKMTVSRYSIDTGSIVTFTENKDNIFDLTLNLASDKNDFDFAYSYPYYGYCNYDFGAYELEWPAGADKAELEINVGGWGTKTVTYDIEEVTFSWSRDGQEWSNPKETEPYRVYVTDKDTWKPKLYYVLNEGWAADDDDYKVAFRKFVGIIGDPKDNNRLMEHFAKSGTDAKGSYVEFTFRDVKEYVKNKTKITAVYEYNPMFGQKVELTEDEKERLSRVTGCDGRVEFCFVEPNLSGLKKKQQPSSMYCPAPEELAGKDYYYINSEERFKIEKAKITYQKLSDGTLWRNQWETRYMEWNEEESIWEFD